MAVNWASVTPTLHARVRRILRRVMKMRGDGIGLVGMSSEPSDLTMRRVDLEQFGDQLCSSWMERSSSYFTETITGASITRLSETKSA